MRYSKAELAAMTSDDVPGRDTLAAVASFERAREDWHNRGRSAIVPGREELTAAGEWAGATR